MTIKIIVIGICVCVLNILLREKQQIFAVLINIVYVVIVISAVLSSVVSTLEGIKDLFEFSDSANKMLGSLMKAATVSIITKISCSICIESGNKVVSDVIDLTGRIALLVIAFPFIEGVIKIAISFIR